MEKIISKKVRQNLNEHTARIILERSDMLASSTLEQLRKSTDRAYTIMGFLITVFAALTAYVFSSPSIWRLAISLTLWIGMGTALFMLLSKVVWVHKFRHVGNDPRNMVQEDNIDMLAKRHTHEDLNAIYSLYTLLDAISINQDIIDHNEKILEDRCRLVEKAMMVVKVSIIIATLTTIAYALTLSIAAWW